MMRRKLFLAGTVLALLLAVGGALSIAGTSGDGLSFNALKQPVMRYGGPFERSMRVVPPLHRKLWPMLLFL